MEEQLTWRWSGCSRPVADAGRRGNPNVVPHPAHSARSPRRGASTRARALLDKARELNPHIPAYLWGQQPKERAEERCQRVAFTIDLAVTDVERSLAFCLDLLGRLGWSESVRHPTYRGTVDDAYARCVSSGQRFTSPQRRIATNRAAIGQRGPRRGASARRRPHRRVLGVGVSDRQLGQLITMRAAALYLSGPALGRVDRERDRPQGELVLVPPLNPPLGPPASDPLGAGRLVLVSAEENRMIEPSRAPRAHTPGK